ncbi:Uncharacterised protein [uncultured archaeon]|nr:Uncharacterised protein [uncultured archaeon]
MAWVHWIEHGQFTELAKRPAVHLRLGAPGAKVVSCYYYYSRADAMCGRDHQRIGQDVHPQLLN